jgi:transposase-like protein
MDVLKFPVESGKKYKRPNLPRADRDRIIAEYVSGRKTGAMLAKEYGVHRNSINKMASRYYQKNSDIFADTFIEPIMPGKTLKPTNISTLQAENERLKRQLKMAELKLEGYQIMGEILEEEYGIDLLKKAGAGQSPILKKDTRE